MEIVGSIVRTPETTFAVIQLRAFLVETARDAEEAIATYGSLFRGMPLVIMAVGGEAGVTYWGQPDLANFMARQQPTSLEWQRFRFAA